MKPVEYALYPFEFGKKVRLVFQERIGGAHVGVNFHRRKNHFGGTHGRAGTGQRQPDAHCTQECTFAGHVGPGNNHHLCPAINFHIVVHPFCRKQKRVPQLFCPERKSAFVYFRKDKTGVVVGIIREADQCIGFGNGFEPKGQFFAMLPVPLPQFVNTTDIPQKNRVKEKTDYDILTVFKLFHPAF